MTTDYIVGSTIASGENAPLTVPANTVTGNTLIMFAAAGASLTAPDGWTLFLSNTAAYGQASSSNTPGSSIEGGSVDGMAIVLAVTGVSKLDTDGFSQPFSSNDEVTTTTLDTTLPDLVIWAFSSNLDGETGRELSLPADLTAAASASEYVSAFSATYEMVIGYKLVLTSPATTDQVATTYESINQQTVAFSIGAPNPIVMVV